MRKCGQVGGIDERVKGECSAVSEVRGRSTTVTSLPQEWGSEAERQKLPKLSPFQRSRNACFVHTGSPGSKFNSR